MLDFTCFGHWWNIEIWRRTKCVAQRRSPKKQACCTGAMQEMGAGYFMHHRGMSIHVIWEPKPPAVTFLCRNNLTFLVWSKPVSSLCSFSSLGRDLLILLLSYLGEEKQQRTEAAMLQLARIAADLLAHLRGEGAPGPTSSSFSVTDSKARCLRLSLWQKAPASAGYAHH